MCFTAGFQSFYGFCSFVLLKLKGLFRSTTQIFQFDLFFFQRRTMVRKTDEIKISIVVVISTTSLIHSFCICSHVPSLVMCRIKKGYVGSRCRRRGGPSISDIFARPPCSPKASSKVPLMHVYYDFILDYFSLFLSLSQSVTHSQTVLPPRVASFFTITYLKFPACLLRGETS